jgi:uncharacterized protein (DUF1778 family)
MAKIGRPTKAKGEQKDALITIRLSADERKAIDAAAKATGKKRSDWARNILTSAANVIH